MNRAGRYLFPRLICAVLALAVVPFAAADLPPEEEAGSFEAMAGGEALTVLVFRQDGPIMGEKRLRPEDGFYFLRYSAGGNIYSVNVPARAYEEYTAAEKKRLVEYTADIYRDSFRKLEALSGMVPEGYRFNITFGRTTGRYTFHVSYSVSKTSNIYADFLPFEEKGEVMTPAQRAVVEHEIAHGLFNLLVGSVADPRLKFLEEGFADYMADMTPEGFERIRIPVTPAMARGMKGLAQGDIDVSIWGEDTVDGIENVRGYMGITHHAAGIEFINAFVDMFGGEGLVAFLVRMKQSEDRLGTEDRGTGRIREVLMAMGHTPGEIDAFEKEYHRRFSENILLITETPPQEKAP